MNLQITNKETKSVQLMSSIETAKFFKINNASKYSVKDLDNVARLKHNKILDILAFICMLVAFMLMTVIYVNTNY